MELLIKPTTQLTNLELINIFIERTKVFVVEQNAAYQEVDEADKDAKHVFFKEQDDIVAYTRIINDEDAVAFGRVLVNESYRGQNLGRKIVTATLDEINANYDTKNVRISAQARLQKFYESFGFKVASEVYLEDNIPHIAMTLNL
ncbi:GNAT family N-acetyltransferase [Staphylococcus kloosii]|uniref:Acetyltransferase n=1 Tax=Staphylococcus kloosii TaxID=29384 RepID=A0A921KUW3_9STAP|nr:GNAT family N-acetyltransferase [Staphylococcus kloosii]AVQ36753.1 GNAT family N-acetyltransferase [Staphylococcus kloosii]MBF7022662.1 GNAT family N-acetyltransferase [Staphylococcus kloosii]PNZ05072.1 GNAT family N-acetyltransferase [Staphylococcus kloosii]PTJ74931.1 GNAT family N-acetyltransferase [Staphylococcus kloosii]SUM49852.1 acetyltransferase [Staphylococcus kloosii]